MSKQEKCLFMNIKDKIVISKKRFCPPHRLPHKLPFGKKITKEPCHIHEHSLRMLHHRPFCKLIKCPNYEFMMKCSKQHKKKP